MRTQSKYRVLVVRLGAMGDILHALPAVTALRQAHLNWTIDWVVEPKWSALLAAADSTARDTEAEKPRQPQSRIRGHGTFARHDLADPALRYTNFLGQTVLRDGHGFEKFLEQDFSGCWVGNLSHGVLSGNRRFRLRTCHCRARQNKSGIDR